ncbi:MAG TPA: pirin family protein [Cyclobacteriaceae bacterium]|nr:pirin family protein [Cyclobacteriaceae bacterium]
MNPIQQIIPLGFPWETRDPFLFCVHHHDFYPAGNEHLGPVESLAGRNIGNDFDPRQKWRMYHGDTVPGFPAHPHCGFETVTVVTKGLIDHSDSLGAAGRFGNGDVQWMTAGKGVQHCEMFPLLNRDRDNPLELFQLWLNLPKVKKSAEPFFSMLWSEIIPIVHAKDKSNKVTQIKIVAGVLGDTQAPAPAPDSWAANPAHEVAIWIIHMEPFAEWALPASRQEVNRMLYYYKGSSLRIQNQEILRGHGVELKSRETVSITNGPDESRLLMLQGKAIGEPVAHYGPFVTNSQSEIQDVIREYQRTQFGGWPWPSLDHTHPRERGRFARYDDGHEEIK